MQAARLRILTRKLRDLLAKVYCFFEVASLCIKMQLG